MTVEQVALQVVDVFNSAGIPYALVGSFASNRWGIPRATKDADFVRNRSGKAGDAMGGARHLCRFTIRLFEGMARFQAFATSGVEAA